MIDLSKLHYRLEDKIDISGSYDIPKDLIDDDMIVEAKNIKVEGSIIDREEDYIICSITGKVKVKDSISLEPIDYKISINLDEILDDFYKKDENTLDIFKLLWENIELEVPLRFTKVQDLSKFQGNGWKLISEDDVPNTSNNPFKNLIEKDNDEEGRV